ncbi:hypothetical protein Micbo1qcDRAFT_216374 [Microdochium bolleyi]|uniref:DUF7730 domain-containing protein n=1 Tax=Microdochium bolleyi TaxID=196109 RepID=A0A136IQU6_9PEZI|nr:hypothetical protein Micbo1qcDRAFT_216374 [Microdochium bolleyi]
MDDIHLLFSSELTGDPLPQIPGATVRHDGTCHLLQLPPEMRNHIYQRVVWHKHAYPLVISYQAPQLQRQTQQGWEIAGNHQMRPRPQFTSRSRPGHTLQKPQRRPWASGLLFACKQIYLEFASIFYQAQGISVRDSIDAVLLARKMRLSGMSPPQPGRLLPRAPVHLVRRLHLYITTPTTQGAASKWILGLPKLARETEGRLEELALTFYHLVPTPEESEGRLWPPLVNSYWDPGYLDPTAEDWHKPPNVDLSNNRAFADALCAFRGLHRLDIRRFSAERWPAILDQFLDKNLELQRAGFMSTITNQNRSELVPTFRAVYRRKQVPIDQQHNPKDGQQRPLPRIERDGARNSLVTTLANFTW